MYFSRSEEETSWLSGEEAELPSKFLARLNRHSSGAFYISLHVMPSFEFLHFLGASVSLLRCGIHYIAQCRHCMKLMQERHGGKGKRCWTFTNNHISSTPNTKKAQIRLASTSLNKFFTQLYKTITRVVFIVTSDNPGWARNHLGGRWLLNEQDIFKRKCHWFGEKNMVDQRGFSRTEFVSRNISEHPHVSFFSSTFSSLSGTTHTFLEASLQPLLTGRQLWG